MADTPTQPAQSPLFGALVGKYGLGPALAILKLLDPNASDLGKGLTGTQLAGTAAQGAGALGGNAGLATLGKGLGTAAGLAGAGYGIYNTATDPNLSTKQKAGHSGELAGETALSLTVPYAGLGVLARHVNGMLENSNSPQVSGVGKGLGFLARPVEGFLSVMSGDKSPRAAGNTMVAQARDTPILGKAISPIFDLLGLGTKPTTGTEFRGGLNSIFGQAGLQGFNRGDASLYNANPGKWAQISPEGQAAAQLLGSYLGSFAPGYSKNPAAYSLQASNILGNTYGNNVGNIANDVYKKFGITPQDAAARLAGLKKAA